MKAQQCSDVRSGRWVVGIGWRVRSRRCSLLGLRGERSRQGGIVVKLVELVGEWKDGIDGGIQIEPRPVVSHEVIVVVDVDATRGGFIPQNDGCGLGELGWW